MAYELDRGKPFQTLANSVSDKIGKGRETGKGLVRENEEEEERENAHFCFNQLFLATMFYEHN